uniref:Copia protein n=1 Tax=Tanacetum cinerariifolium TaxID=118510 RepID=A0A6L2KM54_TANCI|nr:copia protein [Tanacetum cinerariifolium]
MRMEQYLTFTDHALWEVIVNGDSVSPVASASSEGHIPPKTVKQKLARINKLKAKSTLMLSILDEHLLKFHICKDAKSLWEAIKNRFGGNKESKKMQKTILKKNYENFAASSQEGMEKIYGRFQKLISQLEIYGEVIFQEDVNLKLLRSLPLAWNNIALIMRNKSDLDTLSMDDLYNNLKVYESEIKNQSSSSSNSQNVAFVSSDNTSSTNETVNTACSVSTAFSKDQASTASYTDNIDSDYLKEMNLKWQVAMLTMRVKRFIQKTRMKLDLNGKETIGVDRTKVECYNCHKRGHFARECRTPRNQENRNRDAPIRNAPVDTSTTNALAVQDGIESLEVRIVVHEKNEAVYEEDIAFLKYDVQVKDISIKDLKNQLENALKEKDDLKLKLEKFETSSKNLTKLIDSQISATDKTDLGYNGHVNESEVLNNVVDSCQSDGDDNQVNDRFKKSKGYYAVPPSYTGNYMPPRADLSFAGLDSAVFKSKKSDSKDENVFEPKEVRKTVKPSLEKIEFVNARNTTVENENKAKKPRKFSQSPRGNKRNWDGLMTQKLRDGFEFKKKACFICGSINHLIKDYDFYEKKMGNPQYALQDQGIFDSGCSRHMTGNKSYLTDYQEIDGGFVAFGGNAKGGTKADIDAGQARKKTVLGPQYKKSTEVPRKESGVQDPAKEGDKNDQEKDLRDQKEGLIKQPEQESKRYPGRERTQRNKFDSMFGQEKDANGNKMFTPVSTAGYTYVYLNESILVNAATLPNADLPTDPLMLDLEDTANTRVFSGAYDDKLRVQRNKKDKRGIVVRNKARLVAQGYTQEEGIDYDKVFDPVDRIEEIRLFFSYASFMGFIVYQMDVKSAFLYGMIEEEVYVCQPPGFEDLHFPNKVYKVEKALYGLYQASRAWYETLSTYLLENRFRRGIVDKTFFIKNDKGDILLVQVYVDDIIFGSTKKSLCTEFEGLMHKKFQTSFMRELTFFLGLQVM